MDNQREKKKKELNDHGILMTLDNEIKQKSNDKVRKANAFNVTTFEQFYHS